MSENIPSSQEFLRRGSDGPLFFEVCQVFCIENTDLLPAGHGVVASAQVLESEVVDSNLESPFTVFQKALENPASDTQIATEQTRRFTLHFESAQNDTRYSWRLTNFRQGGGGTAYLISVDHHMLSAQQAEYDRQLRQRSVGPFPVEDSELASAFRGLLTSPEVLNHIDSLREKRNAMEEELGTFIIDPVKEVELCMRDSVTREGIKVARKLRLVEQAAAKEVTEKRKHLAKFGFTALKPLKL